MRNQTASDFRLWGRRVRITGTEDWGASELLDKLHDTDIAIYGGSKNQVTLLGALIVLAKTVKKQGDHIEQLEGRGFRAEQRQVDDAGVAQ